MPLTQHGRDTLAGRVAPKARTEPEREFERNLALEIIFAWRDSADAGTRAGLERALFNVGVERREDGWYLHSRFLAI